MGWDEALHPRGAHGRFGHGSGGGAVAKFTHKKAVRNDPATSVPGRRSEAAFRPPRSPSVARQDKARLNQRAQEVNDAYAALRSGQMTGRQRGIVEWDSPSKRTMQRAKTGDVIRPKRNTMSTHMRLAGRGSSVPRQSTRRTATGRVLAVRGYGEEYTDAAGYVKLTKRVRNFAGRKQTNGR